MDSMDSLREVVGLMIMDGYKAEDIKRAVDEAIETATPPEDESEEI